MVSTNSSSPTAIEDNQMCSSTTVTSQSKKKGIRSGLRKFLTVRRGSQPKGSYTLNTKYVADAKSSSTLVTYFADEDDCTNSRLSELDLENDLTASVSSLLKYDESAQESSPQETSEGHVNDLFLKGRSHSSNHRYDEALKCHQQALCSCNRYMKARIEYEISKIELAKINDTSSNRRRHAKSKVHQCAVKYYEAELLRKRQSKSQDSSRDVLSILHTLGRLYDEKLNDFQNALICYNEALAMELLLCGHDQEQIIRKTRRKIGLIHHKMGNFELAMTTSFN